MGSCGGQAVGRVSVKGVGLSVVFLRRTAKSKPFNLIIAVINIRFDFILFRILIPGLTRLADGRDTLCW